MLVHGLFNLGESLDQKGTVPALAVRLLHFYLRAAYAAAWMSTEDKPFVDGTQKCKTIGRGSPVSWSFTKTFASKRSPAAPRSNNIARKSKQPL